LESDTYSLLSDFCPPKILKISNLSVKYSKQRIYGGKDQLSPLESAFTSQNIEYIGVIVAIRMSKSQCGLRLGSAFAEAKSRKLGTDFQSGKKKEDGCPRVGTVAVGKSQRQAGKSARSTQAYLHEHVREDG
jgi:hypothetical protein